MTEKKNDKENFSWKEGGVLDEKNAVPLGDVRQHGLPKINQGVAADPAVRKEEREGLLASKQTHPYHQKSSKNPDGNIIIEESHSGISGDFEDSEIKHLTDKGKQLRGIDRFGKK